jgi:hypothetical protein
MNQHFRFVSEQLNRKGARLTYHMPMTQMFGFWQIALIILAECYAKHLCI